MVEMGTRVELKLFSSLPKCLHVFKLISVWIKPNPKFRDISSELENLLTKIDSFHYFCWQLSYEFGKRIHFTEKLWKSLAPDAPRMHI